MRDESMFKDWSFADLFAFREYTREHGDFLEEMSYDKKLSEEERDRYKKNWRHATWMYAQIDDEMDRRFTSHPLHQVSADDYEEWEAGQ